jgi:hypothetical protein
MTDWQPYGEVVSPAPMTATPIPVATTPSLGGVVCSECGQSFAADQVIRLGNEYVCAGCKPIAAQKLREGVASRPEQIRREHIKHEASVKSVGLLYFLAAAFLLLAGVFGVAASTSGPVRGFGIGVSLVFLALSVAQIWVGIGLRGLKSWARIGSGILSGLGLLGFPVGTLINGYILYLLFSKKGAVVFSDDYKRVIEATPHIKYRTSVVVWIVLGLLLLLLGLGLFSALFAVRR